MLGAGSHDRRRISANRPGRREGCVRCDHVTGSVDDVAIDLRRRSGPVQWTFAVTLAVLAVLAAVGAADGDLAAGARIGAGACAGVAGLGVVALVRTARRTHRLTIDHDGVRLDRGGPAFRLAWSEIAGVGLLVTDPGPPREHILRLVVRMRPVGAVLELVPADAEAVRRHPELRHAWRLGRQRCWRVGLGMGGDGPPPVGVLVTRHRPELWRGERPGSLLSA